jgi:diguanylate cyclase
MIALSAVVVDRDIVMTVADNGIDSTRSLAPRLRTLRSGHTCHALQWRWSRHRAALVRELVEGHGGSVVASSAGTGLGSRFVVTLPLAGVGADG